MAVIKPSGSFPRDSSAPLGMTEVVLFINERAGDHWSPPTGNNCKSLFFHSLTLFSVMLSLSKHLAEALLR